MSDHLLIEITFGGRAIRIADDDIDIYDAATLQWLHFAPGIDSLPVASALNFLASSPTALSVPVECYLPIDVAAEDAAGHHLAGCAATISLWADGDDYADRLVLATGVIVDPEWGEDGEAVTFSISRPVTTSTALALPSAHRVDGVTFPDFITEIDPTDLGIAYPRVYGKPGWISATKWVTGSQLVWFAYGSPREATFVAMIAGHACNMNYVQLNGDGFVGGVQFAVWQTTDGRGQQISVIAKRANYPLTTLNTFVDSRGQTIAGILLNTFTNPSIDNPKAVFVGWASPLSTDTGGLSPVAGDVIVDLLRLAGVAVDYARFQAAAPLLTAFRFDCVIDDPEAKALSWLQSSVYPLLPVSIESGPDGDYPIVWRYDATASDSTAHLDADTDPMISRAGRIKDDASDLANAVSLQYRYSLRTGSYTETVTRDASTCPYCAASERRYGRIEKAITTVVIYDEATAHAILAWMARAYTSPTRRIPYLVPRSYGLAKGQIVTLTDARVSYASRLCLVSDVQIDGSGIDGVELLFIADPLRD